MTPKQIELIAKVQHADTVLVSVIDAMPVVCDAIPLREAIESSFREPLAKLIGAIALTDFDAKPEE